MNKKIILGLLLMTEVICSQAQVTIGALQEPQNFSILELISNQKQGLRLPQMTTDQRNALTETAEFEAEKNPIDGKAMGLQIFNIDTHCVDTWNGAEWLSVCDCSTNPLIITTTTLPDAEYPRYQDESDLTYPWDYVWIDKNTDGSLFDLSKYTPLDLTMDGDPSYDIWFDLNGNGTSDGDEYKSFSEYKYIGDLLGKTHPYDETEYSGPYFDTEYPEYFAVGEDFDHTHWTDKNGDGTPFDKNLFFDSDKWDSDHPGEDPFDSNELFIPGQLLATGGEAPYVWQLVSGTLPPGLTLDPYTGLISGPYYYYTDDSGLGSIYIFTIRVVDKKGCSATKNLQIIVRNPPHSA